MKTLFTLVTVLLFSFSSFAQPPIDHLIKEGIELHDQGQYTDAIGKYEAALALDKQSSVALYEIAYSYYALKDYKQALKYVNRVIKLNKGNLLESYITKGSILDEAGDPKKAIQTYEQAIEMFPDHHLLYYNLGLTLYRQRNLEAAETVLQAGIERNPAHPSGHYLLGIIKQEQNQRVPALLSLYFFLMLEPESPRSGEAFALAAKLRKQGVNRTGTKEITIGFNPDAEGFSTIDLMLSMLEASKGLVKDAEKQLKEELDNPNIELTLSEEEQFFQHTESFFDMLEESSEEKSGFWWELYVPIFSKIKQDGHLEAFCYYLSQSQGDAATAWIDTHEVEMQAFYKWFEADE
jgi:tetratricopeptide (TPR) repeat protein